MRSAGMWSTVTGRKGGCPYLTFGGRAYVVESQRIMGAGAARGKHGALDGHVTDRYPRKPPSDNSDKRHRRPYSESVDHKPSHCGELLRVEFCALFTKDRMLGQLKEAFRPLRCRKGGARKRVRRLDTPGERAAFGGNLS